MKAYVWPVDGSMPPTTSPRWRRFIENYLPMVVIYLMVATLVAIVLYPHMVVTVPSGQVGVLWKRFGGGTVLDPRRLKNEGFNLILPAGVFSSRTVGLVAVILSLFIVSLSLGGTPPAGGSGVSTLPRMTGKPSLPLPIKTTFEFVDCES